MEKKTPWHLVCIVFWSAMGSNGPKILIFMGLSKTFGTNIAEKPLSQLVQIVFWSGIGSNRPKMPIFGQKCQFWTKFGRFWAKTIFWANGVKLLVSSYQGTNETPFLCWKHWPVRLKLAARDENVQFWSKNLDIWGQKSIFCMVIAIFVNRAYHQYAWGYHFPIWTNLKFLRDWYSFWKRVLFSLNNFFR